MNSANLTLFILIIVAAFASRFHSAAQMKQMALNYETGQRYEIAVRLEANAVREGKMLVTVDSIDSEQSIHFSIEPAEPVAAEDTVAGKLGGRKAYLGGTKVTVKVNPRGEALFKEMYGKQFEKWMQGIKADSVYLKVWGNQSITMSYQFLFPGIVKAYDVKEALGKMKKKNLCSFATDSPKEAESGEYTSVCRTIETIFSKGKSYKIKGVKCFDLTRSETEETEHGGNAHAQANKQNKTQTTIWTLRESDYVVIKENTIAFTESSLGWTQSLSRTFTPAEKR